MGLGCRGRYWSLSFAALSGSLFFRLLRIVVPLPSKRHRPPEPFRKSKFRLAILDRQHTHLVTAIPTSNGWQRRHATQMRTQPVWRTLSDTPLFLSLK